MGIGDNDWGGIEMKRFERDGKINFVDENNVFVGYDIEQSCCEYADYYFSYEKEIACRDNTISDEIIEPYSFDVGFFEQIEDFGDGGLVRFRLIAEGREPLYLHLFNSHNGYYCHGFVAEINGIEWKSNVL